MREVKLAIDEFQISPDTLWGIFKGCEMDITKDRYQNYDELYEYCYHVAGLVGVACLKIFGYHSNTAHQMAIDLGLAFQLTNIIRDVKSDLELGRIYLPLYDIERFGYSEEQLINRQDTAEFKNLLEYYANKAEDYYQKAALEFNNDTQGQLDAARLMSLTYHRILNKLRKDHFPVLTRKVSLSRFEKISIVLRSIFSK